jgi:hypothetical protein
MAIAETPETEKTTARAGGTAGAVTGTAAVVALGGFPAVAGATL